MRRGTREALTGWVTVLPALTVQVIFIYLPLAWAFYVSFFSWNMIRPMRYVGLRNYERLFSSPDFWNSMGVTGIYILGTVIPSVIIGLLLAALLNIEWIKGRGLFRTLFYIPVVTSMAAAAVIWGWLYEPNFGLVNYFLSIFGISNIKWLSDPNYALLALIIVGVWKRIGYNMVLFLAGLQTIPKTYYEAAEIDGATPWRKFVNITLPLLSPTTLFVFIMQFIASFRVFVSVSVMTSGGPAKSTQVITYYLYENAFKYLKFGYASAVAVVMFAMMVVFTLIQFRVSKGRVHYQ
ncbi:MULTISPECIES: sugar ABC transporter permease [Mesotoga]|uniref:carbohydrate ABC transporter permease n=1 Tax=Mesotoga TaxID=1184396 RepID=UPI00039A637A|nr:MULTISPECIES: sugar ABC transporter permease [Mesotoga]MCP5457354.1 sugar ABC transporter permease [Thermotogota bacterium]MCP5460720.1 sugar ABC transporter permease [Thermotogota bacterium]MDK2945245.1 multiple sugar transport system permease protein [Mesotoga sp.]RLL86624.1 ABC transporter permease [Mesotoga sp. H07pep.5.4]RLL91834.1 ABC transporter permease [Mesotoga sp. HF07.pep.5.2.highcov]